MEMGDVVAPVAMMHLGDPQWYVQRNMLCILGELAEMPEGFKADDFLQHEDPRVRREALRIMFKWPTTRERGIGHALADPDEGLVRLALGAAAERCPKAAVPLVVSRASSGTMDTRLAAIRVLGSLDDSSALQALLRMTQPTRKLFRWKHPKKTQAYIAALKALSRHADKPPVRNVLKLAARRRDPNIAAAIRGLVLDETTQAAQLSGNGDATETDNPQAAAVPGSESIEEPPSAEDPNPTPES
jgi:HEAT repeat protein